MYKAPPPEVSSEQFYETDERARLRARLLDPDGQPAPDRLGRARARRRPPRRSPARVHARLQPLGGARLALRAAAAPGEPRHARRRDATSSGCRSRASTTPSATTTARTSPSPRQTMHAIWETAGAQDVLTIDRYAHLVGGCRMGTRRREQRHRLRPPRLGRPQPVRLRRQRHADAGERQPGAHDHGARLAPWPALVSQTSRSNRRASDHDEGHGSTRGSAGVLTSVATPSSEKRVRMRKHTNPEVAVITGAMFAAAMT